jgi:predicted HTH transcriptional regulator
MRPIAAGAAKDDYLNSYQSDIRKVLSREIAPSVEVSFELMGLGSQHVLVIHITEGKEKPYRVIKNNEIFIRVGANNIRPTPDELKQMFGNA